MPLIQWYTVKNRERPLVTKSVTSAGLLASGDSICQLCERRFNDPSSASPPGASNELRTSELALISGIDFSRVTRMAAWGLLIGGPSSHWFYNAVERVVPPAWTGAKCIAAKVFIDQALYTPPLTLAFFTFQNFFSSPSYSPALFAESLSSGGEKLWPTLKVNWVYWSCVHVATFSVIPLEFRVLFVASKNLFWSAFLSVVAYAPKQ